MNVLLKLLLVACIGVMGFLCVESIMGPIRFDEQKQVRDKATIARLIDIRKAQIEFKNVNGYYTDEFDSLIVFIKNGKLPYVIKEGSLTDQQLEAGLTEEKAMAIITKGNQKDIEKNGLTNFRRDTIFVNVQDTVFGKGFIADSIKFVPFTGGQKQFEMQTGDQINQSGYILRLFEARTPYKDYLMGLDKQEVINLTDRARKMEKYAGLKVGDSNEPNNNASNRV